MDEALPWFRRFDQPEQLDGPAKTNTTARFGGNGNDEPVLVGIVHGPVEAEMAQDALQSAGIPAFIKRNSLGSLYGLSIGSFGSAEIWVHPALAEQAYTELVGMGLINPSSDTSTDETTP